MLFLGIQDMTPRSLVRPFCDDYNTPCTELKSVYTTGRTYERSYDLGIYCEEVPARKSDKYPRATRVLSASDIDLEGISFHTMGRLIEMIMGKCTYYFSLPQIIRLCKVAENLTYQGVGNMRRTLELDDCLYQAYKQGDMCPRRLLRYEDAKPLVKFVEDFCDYADLRTNAYNCAARLLGRDFLPVGSTEYLEFARREEWLSVVRGSQSDTGSANETVDVYGQLGFMYTLPIEFARSLPQLRDLPKE